MSLIRVADPSKKFLDGNSDYKHGRNDGFSEGWNAVVDDLEHVGWLNKIGDNWVYFHGTADPREVHDNGKPFKKVYVTK